MISVLHSSFMEFHGNGTKQIGRNFCILASLCNAVRLCGVAGCTQERVRDAWYAEKMEAIEQNLDDQMNGADFGFFETMERHIEGMGVIHNECFQRQGDCDPTDLRNADIAVDFIERHIAAEHPVIVSTWNRVYKGDIIEIHGYHMWLILDFDRAANLATYHDSDPDEIRQISITKLQPIKLKAKDYEIDSGLRGCITHSDYTCLALWKEAV